MQGWEACIRHGQIDWLSQYDEHQRNSGQLDRNVVVIAATTEGDHHRKNLECTKMIDMGDGCNTQRGCRQSTSVKLRTLEGPFCDHGLP